jgi:hypothetical protein
MIAIARWRLGARWRVVPENTFGASFHDEPLSKWRKRRWQRGRHSNLQSGYVLDSPLTREVCIAYRS